MKSRRLVFVAFIALSASAQEPYTIKQDVLGEPLSIYQQNNKECPKSLRLPGASQQFHAQVKGTTNDTVIWSVAGRGCSVTACGTIDGAGLYTAPLDIPDPATVTVTATLAADASEAASTSVTIVPKRPH